MNTELTPERMAGEPFEAYRTRRRQAQKAVKQYLRGQRAYESTKLVMIPLAGEDEKADELLRQRFYRKPFTAANLDANGKPYRVARTKGTPYVKPKELKFKGAS